MLIFKESKKPDNSKKTVESLRMESQYYDRLC
jgi:hypothetical protein